MIKVVNGINVNFINYGKENSINIVLLHGWGQNIEMMMPIGNELQSKYNITIIDLPGYGESEEPKSVWTVYDYASCVNEILKELKIDNPILIGHSFGGKISLVYASIYGAKKLVLFGSPYRPQITKLSFKTKLLKTLNKVPVLNKLSKYAKRFIGSTDYRNASEMMRNILVSTVNLDITEDVKKIKCPTLIVWGTLDEAVPLETAYELEKLISNSGVVVYENCTHYAYLENLFQTIRVLNVFIESKE